VRPNFAEAAFQLTELQFQHGELAPARAGIDAFIGSYDATADLLLLGVRVARAQGDQVGAQRYARRLQMDFPEPTRRAPWRNSITTPAEAHGE